jgi:putative ABC transport system substrate-binding protein
MDRRRFLLTSLAGALAAPLAAEPQQPGRLWRIGILSPTSPSNAQALHDRLRAGLRDLGYVEGQNLIIEYRWAERKNDRLPGLAAELVHLRVDLIVANGTAGAFAAHDATNTIPIVMADASDPVRDGLVASLARPGGNVTGLTIFAPELVGKQLELLKDVVPKFARVAVLSNPDNRTHAFSVMEAEVAARVLRVHVQSVRVRSPDDFGNAFSALMSGHANALLLLPDWSLDTTLVVEWAIKRRLPTMSGLSVYAQGGVLITYGPSLGDLYHRAAAYVDKILKGSRPADLPVEQPTIFELVINLKTAKALGLTIPPSLLARADQVLD